ncbi:MAG TPA: hypothetical protein ENH94_04595 [Phycisphaerales bacterium]|nr:hypothetical protein [Phycisphaerales bacterium]
MKKDFIRELTDRTGFFLPRRKGVFSFKSLVFSCGGIFSLLRGKLLTGRGLWFRICGPSGYGKTYAAIKSEVGNGENEKNSMLLPYSWQI